MFHLTSDSALARDAVSSACWDAIIIGGGPAGSTAATTLAKAGRRVLLLEKSKFPRFHVGESLLPYNRAIFEKLGVWEKIAAAGFMTKRGAQFWMGNGSRHNRLDFSQGSFTEYPESIQVERCRFDKILLDHSRECGAEVREEALVQTHRVTDGRVTVKYQVGDGEEITEQAKFLIDASGLANFTGNKAALRTYYAGHRKVAIFGHYENVAMPKGEEKGDILIVRRENSWFWLIPLHDRKTSVGLVLDLADFKAHSKKPEQVFDDAVRSTKAVADRFAHAAAITPLHMVTDFSYQNDRLVSPHVVRAGDASGFVDPIFSSGVMLAMTSGQECAQVVDEAIRANSPMTAGMKRYERNTRKRIGMYWEFIENFYKLHFAQLFFQPVNKLKMLCAINAVLAGRTELPLSARLRLRVFFTLAWLNKRLPVARRIQVN